MCISVRLRFSGVIINGWLIGLSGVEFEYERSSVARFEVSGKKMLDEIVSKH